MSGNRILAFNGRLYADRVTAEATKWWHEAIVAGELRQCHRFGEPPQPIGLTYGQQCELDTQLDERATAVNLLPAPPAPRKEQTG